MQALTNQDAMLVKFPKSAKKILHPAAIVLSISINTTILMKKTLKILVGFLLYIYIYIIKHDNRPQ